LFVLYTVDLISLIENTIFRHMCADDAQVYDHCLRAAVDVRVLENNLRLHQ